MRTKMGFIQAFVLARASDGGTSVEEDIELAEKTFDKLESMRIKLELEKEKQNPLDGKVHGELYSNKDGRRLPVDEYVVFRPQDNAFVAILPPYLEMCKKFGADAAQLKAVDRLITKVIDWRANHINRCKAPDVEPGELPENW